MYRLNYAHKCKIRAHFFFNPLLFLLEKGLVPRSYVINFALDLNLDRTLTLGCDSAALTFFPLRGSNNSHISSLENIIVLSRLFIS